MNYSGSLYTIARKPVTALTASVLPNRGKQMLAEIQKASPEEAKEQRAALGVWLKELREEQKLSQRDLADRLSLDYYTFISQLENGRGRIPVHRYSEWAAALGKDQRSFVRKLLSYYEPTTYKILFDPADV